MTTDPRTSRHDILPPIRSLQSFGKLLYHSDNEKHSQYSSGRIAGVYKTVKEARGIPATPEQQECRPARIAVAW